MLVGKSAPVSLTYLLGAFCSMRSILDKEWNLHHLPRMNLLRVGENLI
jgi:hypothetical protein